MRGGEEVHFLAAVPQMLTTTVAHIQHVLEALKIAFYVATKRGSGEIVLSKAAQRSDAEKQAGGGVGGGDLVDGCSRRLNVGEELGEAKDEEVH